MAKFYQTKRFIELSRLWETKLIASGFEDVEKKRLQAYRKSNVLVRDAKKEYFRALDTKVNEHEFEKHLDLTIMRLRADGMRIKQIAVETNIHRQTVRYIIRRYEHAWGIRYWTIHQRHLKYG